MKTLKNSLTSVFVLAMLLMGTTGLKAQTEEALIADASENELMLTPQVRAVKIYPNPAAGAFTVQFECNTTAAFRIAMYDMVGNEVFSNTYHREAGIYSRHFDTNGYEPGVYLMRISCGGETSTHKVIIKG